MQRVASHNSSDRKRSWHDYPLVAHTTAFFIAYILFPWRFYLFVAAFIFSRLSCPSSTRGNTTFVTIEHVIMI